MDRETGLMAVSGILLVSFLITVGLVMRSPRRDNHQVFNTDVSTADTPGAMERHIHRHRNDNSDYTLYCLSRGTRVFVYAVNENNKPIEDKVTIITLDKVITEPLGTNVPCTR